MPPSLLFVAGDPSGDQHAAPVIDRLRVTVPGVDCFGIGGPAMERAGFRPVLPFAPFNRMGFAEVAAHLPFFLSAKRRIVDLMRKRRPSAVVCVDYPGFNIPLMKAAHGLGIPVAWYIVPQVWAWKPRRAEVLGRYARVIGAVFPFETRYFEGFGAAVAFVGHPLVEAMAGAPPALLDTRNEEALQRHREHTLRIALVPGSRRQEVDRMLGPMVEAFVALREEYPRLSARVSTVPNVDRRLYQRHMPARGIDCFAGTLDELLAQSDAAIVTSGTATLQTALWQVPMVVCYKTSELTYALLRRLVKMPYIGLPNIVAGERIVPECVQHQAEGLTLATRMRRYIESENHYLGTRRRLAGLREKLGEKKPSEEMAALIAGIVRPS